MSVPSLMTLAMTLLVLASCSVTSTVGWSTSTLPTTTTFRRSTAVSQRPTPMYRLNTLSSSSLSEGGDRLQGNDNEAERLRQEARKLREEVEEFEKKKEAMEQAEREAIQAELKERQALIDRYSVVVPILKPDGTTVEEKIQFPPRLEEMSGKSGCSTILLCEAKLPLGILLGEHETLEGMTEVDEVPARSNGAMAGIREGDLLRACTACKFEMEQPTWQLMAGGIGRPKTVRYMFSTDFRPFELVMEAVASNRMDPEGRSVLLVLERNESR